MDKQRKGLQARPVEGVPRAIECPECGCGHFEVIKVQHKTRKTVRRKQCRNCGRRITTIEVLKDGQTDAG